MENNNKQRKRSLEFSSNGGNSNKKSSLELPESSKLKKNKTKNDNDSRKTNSKNFVTNADLKHEIQMMCNETIRNVHDYIAGYRDETVIFIRKIIEETLKNYCRKSTGITVNYSNPDSEFIKFASDIKYINKNDIVNYKGYNVSQTAVDDFKKMKQKTKEFERMENVTEINDSSKSTSKKSASEVTSSNVRNLKTLTRIDIDPVDKVPTNSIRRVSPESPKRKRDSASANIPTPAEKFTENQNTHILCNKNSQIVDMTVINKWLGSYNKNHSIKIKDVFEKMMEPKKLFSLFKCMAAKCDYTTISEFYFNKHISHHVSKDHNTKDYYMHCSYCKYIAVLPCTLADHIKKQHGFCRYQCNLCFYRAVEEDAIFDHQVEHHSEDSKKCEILEGPELFPLLFSKEKEIKKAHKICDKHIKYITCMGCSMRFFIPGDFINHAVEKNHKDVEKFKIVEQQREEIERDIFCKKLGKYQCIFCDKKKTYGSNDLMEMRKHLQDHPDNIHYFFSRNLDKVKYKKAEKEKGIKTKCYDGKLDELLNEKGIDKIEASF